jgi:hypothetical protein
MTDGAGSVKGDESDVRSEETVAYETYKKVLDQRKADQAKARELTAEVERLRSERESEQEAKLAEQKRFEELYAAEKKKAEELSARIKDAETKSIAQRKRDALKQALGGVKRDEYLSFADLNSVLVQEDGTVDADSVKAAAAKFREAHPELITSRQATPLPSESATGFAPPKGKALHELNPSELKELYSKLHKVK